jgi:predicted TIM-barrel fold metal-dependent hydrolase
MERLSSAGGDDIRRYLKDNIFFDMTHPHSWGKDVIEAAVKVSGADHMLFGSSFPVFSGWMKQGVEFMEGLEVTDQERDDMLFNNAKRMFKLAV